MSAGSRRMPLGNSDSVQVGDPVVAIGAPFDLADTVTSGIISAKERPITAGGEGATAATSRTWTPCRPTPRSTPGTPAARSSTPGPGSSASTAPSAPPTAAPAWRRPGRLHRPRLRHPVNQAKRVAEELINTGRATHPVIGVTLDMDYTGDGARVGARSADGGPAVTADGPGARAGHQAGRRHHRGRRHARALRRGTHREDPRPPPGRPAPELTLERAGQKSARSPWFSAPPAGLSEHPHRWPA